MSVIVDSSFNIEDILRTTSKHADQIEPKAEELVTKLRKLQRAKRTLEEEVKEALSLKSTLQEEDEALTTEAFQLDVQHKEREESCRIMQFKCEELEQESQRQLEQNHQKEELVEQYSCQIQETKLKHRKIRMKFENQLQQMMDQHKNLCSMFTPDRLSAEVQTVGNATAQLLKAEQLKLEQLTRLQEDLRHTHSTAMQTDADTHTDTL